MSFFNSKMYDLSSVNQQSSRRDVSRTHIEDENGPSENDQQETTPLLSGNLSHTNSAGSMKSPFQSRDTGPFLEFNLIIHF